MQGTNVNSNISILVNSNYEPNVYPMLTSILIFNRRPAHEIISKVRLFTTWAIYIIFSRCEIDRRFQQFFYLEKNNVTARPVSYTHLDVYKRQLQQPMYHGGRETRGRTVRTRGHPGGSDRRNHWKTWDNSAEFKVTKNQYIIFKEKDIKNL